MALPLTNNFTVYRGDPSEPQAFDIKDSDDQVIPLTGYAVRMQVRTLRDDLVLDLSNSNGLEVNEHDEIILALTAEQTATMQGNYMYDIQVTDLEGVPRTIVRGKINVIPDVTR